MKVRCLLYFIAAVAWSYPLTAEIKLPEIFSDGMVFQRNMPVKIWGTADANSQVDVEFNGKKCSAKAGADGKWTLNLPPMEASDSPRKMNISENGKPAKTVSDILVGEVWILGGQSNMEMTLRGYGDCPVEGFNEAVLASLRQQDIHYVRLPHRMGMTPLEDTPCRWQAVSPQTVTGCSAVGYFFASLLQRVLDVPVGLLDVSRGGTRVESWLDRENLSLYTDEPTDTAGIVAREPDPARRAMVWHNGMFAPILNYTVRGIMFYQGCSNVGDPGNQYSQRLELLVRQWRRQFALGDIPFYNVQLAPYWAGNDMETTILSEYNPLSFN